MGKKTTIGIPAYNEEKYIGKTIESALGQADEIIISDNFSTDGTEDICQKYISMYPYIKYFRNEKTVSMIENWIRLIHLSDCDYFMYLGAHDLLSNNYVNILKESMEQSNSILAFATSLHVDHNYSFMSVYKCPYASDLLNDNKAFRYLSYIKNFYNGTMYYGLIKKKFLDKAIDYLDKFPFKYTDNTTLAILVTMGKFSFAAKASYYRVYPRKPYADCYEFWNRMLKDIYQETYDPCLHYPELIPANVFRIQYEIAREVAYELDDPEDYLKKVYNILVNRSLAESSVHRVITRVLAQLLDEDLMSEQKIMKNNAHKAEKE